MSEPVNRGGEWWTRADDGSWLRWNPGEYRWDPSNEPPPPPDAASAPESAAATAAATEGSGSSDVQLLRDFEPASGKANVAMVLVGLSAIASAIQAPLLLDRAGTARDLLGDSSALLGVASARGFVFLASVIAVLVWFKAAYDNLRPLGATNLRYTPGWAIGGWFIPIGNLFIPKQIANDLWRASDPALPPDQGEKWKFAPKTGLLHLWWGAWIVSNVLEGAARGTEQVAIDQVDVGGINAAIRLAAASQLAQVVAGVALIVLIRRLSARQQERAAALAASSPDRARVLGLPA